MPAPSFMKILIFTERARGVSSYHQHEFIMFWVVLSWLLMGLVSSTLELIFERNRDMERCIAGLGGIFLATASTIKQITNRLLRKKRKELYEKILADWEATTNSEEIYELQKACRSRIKVCIVYAIAGTLAFATFGFIILVKESTLYLVKSNKTQVDKNSLLLPLYRPWNIENLVYVELFLQTFTFTLMGLVHLAHDTVYLMLAQHSCALLKIVSIRVKRAVHMDISANESDLKSHLLAINCINSAIDLHNTAFKMIKAVEEMYTITWLITLVMNTIGVGVCCIAVLVSGLRDGFFYLIRNTAISLGSTMHFGFIFLPGQKLIDCNDYVLSSCCETEWYSSSQRMKKLLLFIMLRSKKTCHLTGGNVMILCMETFSKLMKSGFSFFTLFSSFF